MKKPVVLIASIVAAGAMLLVIGFLTRPKGYRDDAAGRQAIFQQVWHTIGVNFYDRDMNGLDWLAVRTTYEQKVRKTRNSFDLYWNVLMPMAAMLESSHVQVTPPTSKQPDQGVFHASLNASEPDLEACAGLVYHLGRRPVSIRVLELDSDSPLHARGVKAGWRFYGVNAAASDEQRLTLLFLSTSGESVEVAVQATEGLTNVDLALIRSDLAKLGSARMQAADPAESFTLESLRMTVSLGQNGTMAGVVDVDHDSLAERSGIEPGSEFQEFQLKPEKSGVRSFSAKLISPEGRHYSASFNYQCATRDLISVRVSRQLADNTLYLRFDVFDDGAAKWIGDELGSKKPRAVILDLRRNMGGIVPEVRDVMGHFLPAGTRLAVMTSPEGSDEARASASPVVFQGPMAVLVGPNTASGAEISANALKVHKRAELYGLDSFGNVLQSYFFRLDDGGSVMVATHDVRGPDGGRIENVGVKVDHEVRQTLASVRSGHDIVIDRALADLARASSN